MLFRKRKEKDLELKRLRDEEYKRRIERINEEQRKQNNKDIKKYFIEERNLVTPNGLYQIGNLIVLKKIDTIREYVIFNNSPAIKIIHRLEKNKAERVIELTFDNYELRDMVYEKLFKVFTKHHTK